MDWMKIVWAILLIMMIIFIFPQARHMLKNSRKGSSQEWLNVSILLGGVLLFIWVLTRLV